MLLRFWKSPNANQAPITRNINPRIRRDRLMPGLFHPTRKIPTAIKPTEPKNIVVGGKNAQTRFRTLDADQLKKAPMRATQKTDAVNLNRFFICPFLEIGSRYFPNQRHRKKVRCGQINQLRERHLTELRNYFAARFSLDPTAL
jgi:hypothetical protein